MIHCISCSTSSCHSRANWSSTLSCCSILENQPNPIVFCVLKDKMGAAESALQKTVTPEFLFLDNWVPEPELLPNGTRLSNGTPLPNATRERFFIRLKVPSEFRDITSPPLPEHLDFMASEVGGNMEVVTPVHDYRFNSKSRLYKLYKLRIEETGQLTGCLLYTSPSPRD